MILPDYEYCIKYWEEQEQMCLNKDSTYIYGLSAIDTEIVPIIVIEYFAVSTEYNKPIKLNDNTTIYFYYFTHKPSKKEFDQCLKDFAIFLKNEIIKNDFT